MPKVEKPAHSYQQVLRQLKARKALFSTERGRERTHLLPAKLKWISGFGIIHISFGEVLDRSGGSWEVVAFWVCFKVTDI